MHQILAISSFFVLFLFFIVVDVAVGWTWLPPTFCFLKKKMKDLSIDVVVVRFRFLLSFFVGLDL